ncbi:hypothetical protein PGB90_003349 [Kerria lacca]
MNFKISSLRICFCLLLILSFLYLCFQFKSVTINGGNVEEYTLRTNLTKWINMSSLELIYNSNICLYKKPKIIILITSHVQNIEARKTIRQSYPKDLLHKYNTQIIFLLAVIRNTFDELTFKTQREVQQHGDIIQGNFIEAYRNLTYKHLMGYKWTIDSCPTVEYIIKMDDDIVVNYYKLFSIIEMYKSRFELMGYVFKNMKPIRDESNKWYVPLTEYKNSVYPEFLSGWIYIATFKTLQSLMKQSNLTPYFWIDDVFITGILREKARINVTDIKEYFRYDPKNIECCILNKYSCDFLAAPNGKDFSLNLKFNNHLWECRYKKKCKLESNTKTSCLWSSNSFAMKKYLLL